MFDEFSDTQMSFSFVFHCPKIQDVGQRANHEEENKVRPLHEAASPQGYFLLRRVR